MGREPRGTTKKVLLLASGREGAFLGGGSTEGYRAHGVMGRKGSSAGEGGFRKWIKNRKIRDALTKKSLSDESCQLGEEKGVCPGRERGSRLRLPS